MTKADFVAKIAEKSGMTKKDAEAFTSTVFDEITATVKAGDKLTVLGLGTFKAADVKEKVCRNPHTGETITVAAHKKAAFVPCKELKSF